MVCRGWILLTSVILWLLLPWGYLFWVLSLISWQCTGLTAIRFGPRAPVDHVRSKFSICPTLTVFCAKLKMSAKTTQYIEITYTHFKRWHERLVWLQIVETMTERVTSVGPSAPSAGQAPDVCGWHRPHWAHTWWGYRSGPDHLVTWCWQNYSEL